MMLRVAKELNLPVTALADTPAHWIGAAMMQMEWAHLEQERASKRSRRSSKMNETPRVKQRGG